MYSPNQIISIYITQSCNPSTEAKLKLVTNLVWINVLFLRIYEKSEWIRWGELLPSCTWTSRSFSFYFMLMVQSLASQVDVRLQQSNQYSGKWFAFCRRPINVVFTVHSVSLTFLILENESCEQTPLYNPSSEMELVSTTLLLLLA